MNKPISKILLLCYTNVIFFLILNPYLRFSQFPNSEVDPLAFFLCLPVVIPLMIRRKVSPIVLYTYPFLILVLINAVASPLILRENLVALNYFTSLGIIISPLVVFIFCDYYKKLFSKYVLNISIFLWFAVGSLQQFLPYLVPKDFLSVLISRFEGVQIDEVRGVQALATEPSAVTYPVIFFAFFSIYLFQSQKISRKNLILNLLMIVSLVFLSRSFVFIANVVLGLVLYVALNLKTGTNKYQDFPKKIAVSLLIVFVGILTVLAIGFIFPQNRVGDFLAVVIDNDLLSNNPLMMIVVIAGKLGDLRLVQFMAAYNCLSLFPLGSGVGGFETSFAASWESLFEGFGLREVARANSYGGHVASELGIPGLIAIMLLHWYYWRNSIGLKKIPVYKVTSFFMGLSWIYFSSIASLSIPWLMLVML